MSVKNGSTDVTSASINVTCEQNGTYQVYANFEADAPAVAGVSLYSVKSVTDTEVELTAEPYL